MQGLEIALQIPDLWQQEAVRVLYAGGDVVVDAPTGAGKTWVFELFVKGRKSGAGQAVFTVPTRALANDKWREWRKLGWEVGIATGDLAENLDAPVLVATLETQRERLLSGDGPALLAIDEYQMIADKGRGLSYELAPALAPMETQLLLASGSVENPGEVVDWLRRLGRDAHLVQTLERPVPLEEMPVEELPRLPEKTGPFWARVAGGVCLAGMEPLLLFAPRRDAAEALARKVASALPDDDPIELPTALAGRAGKALCKLLRSRVAFHHSGLDYETRAAVVEPLAKAGQLRVVVATTGLAAGINFSVRSVAITDTAYREGAYLRELGADEVLQMFGRAGRRGLDEVGYAITARHTPTLFDAAALKLRRVNQIDWPTLLRVMRQASIDGRDPFQAAADACARLFSSQKLTLGVELDAKPVVEKEEIGVGQFSGPRREEFQDADGGWHALEGCGSQRPLRECWAADAESGEWVEALRSPDFVKTLARGRLFRYGDGVFGIEAKVARLQKADADGIRKVAPLGWVKRAVSEQQLGKMTREEFETLVLPELEPHFEIGNVRRLVRRGALLAAQLVLEDVPHECVCAADGRALIDPPRRTVAIDVDTAYRAAGMAIDPPPGTAAHAWRKLGLVDERGHPTRRGEIVSLFQGGEGLVVAAALEEEAYPVEELAWHLANLRAGHRFRETEGGGSARLAAAARTAYGMVDHDGYLELGLPPGYGEGAAEVLHESIVGRGYGGETLAAGDIERARVEWLSLLRHVAQAPAPEWGRWGALAEHCAKLLQTHARDELNADFDALGSIVARRKPRRLHRGDFR